MTNRNKEVYEVVSFFARGVNAVNLTPNMHRETLIVVFDMTSKKDSIAFYEITELLENHLDCSITVNTYKSQAIIKVNLTLAPAMHGLLRLYCLDKERQLLQLRNDVEEVKTRKPWYKRLLTFLRTRHEF